MIVQKPASVRALWKAARLTSAAASCASLPQYTPDRYWVRRRCSGACLGWGHGTPRSGGGRPPTRPGSDRRRLERPRCVRSGPSRLPDRWVGRSARGVADLCGDDPVQGPERALRPQKQPRPTMRTSMSGQGPVVELPSTVCFSATASGTDRPGRQVSGSGILIFWGLRKRPNMRGA